MIVKNWDALSFKQLLAASWKREFALWVLELGVLVVSV